MTQDTSMEMLERFRQGDERAAEELFARYVARLTLLARSRLSSKLASRTDPEDVVFSAYRSFFVGVREGRFELARSGDLWRLLVSITMHKLYRQVRTHTAEKRSVSVEQTLGSVREGDLSITSQPSPEEAIALADELSFFMTSLDSFSRRVLELRLQEETLATIAENTGRSERTVRRALQTIRQQLANQLLSESDQIVISSLPATIDIPPTPPSSIRSMDIPRTSLAYSDFLLQEMVGAGRMGRVYRAWQQSQSRPVAVKYLRKAFLDHPDAVERFVQEASIVSQFQHTGIVTIHGLGRAPSGGYFIVMDLINGTDLSKVDCQSMTLQDIVHWTIQGCEAIAHSHEHGIIHCDLKPANLLLDENRDIRVTDFGLSRSIAEASLPLNRIEGTASFMAPEQVSGWWGPITCRTDVYGMGAVLYSMLTGKVPHEGATLTDILSRVVSGVPVVAPVELRPDLPTKLNEICLRCLAKSPEQRFENMAQLIQSLVEVREVLV